MLSRHAIPVDRAKGNKARAAALGISRTKLYTRLRQLGLPQG